jgi:Tol biopolymer transport system component
MTSTFHDKYHYQYQAIMLYTFISVTGPVGVSKLGDAIHRLTFPRPVRRLEVVMSIQRIFPLLVIFYLIGLSACAPPQTVEPVAEAEVIQTAPALVTVTPISYPTGYPPYPTVPSGTGYPPPTATFGPTPTPDTPPTFEPSPTVPPLLTNIPTPDVTPVPTVEPPFIPLPPDQEPQPFSILYTEGNTIWAVDSSGGNPYPLANVQDALSLYIERVSEAFGHWGAASPDGARLAVVLSSQETFGIPHSDYVQVDYPEIGIYLFDIQQQTWNKLVDQGLEPVWSPDGSKIAYRGPQGGLWVVEVATGNTREIYGVKQEEGYPAFAIDFSWAPDSQRLVFVDRVVYGTRDIVIVDVTQPESATILIPDAPYRSYNARWSSTNEQILFASHVGVQSASDDIINLWVIHSDGSSAAQITQDLEVISGGRSSLSPNGEWMAIPGYLYYELEGAGTELLLVNIKTREWRRPYNTPDVNEIDPLWSPDGRHLVVQRAGISGDGSSRSLWLINLYDGSEMELATTSVQDVVILPR